MSINPTDTPPTAPAGKALPLPTAEPCLSCGTTGGLVHPNMNRPERKRGLCHSCYARARTQGVVKQWPACGAVSVPYLPHAGGGGGGRVWPDNFEGFPPDHIHTPTGWPIVPVFTAAPPLPPRRWERAVWLWSPDDPRLVGCLSEVLLDRDEARAA